MSIKFDIKRVGPAVRWSRKRFKKFAQARHRMLKEYAGRHYVRNNEHMDRNPINMLRMAVTIYSRMLMPTRPRAEVTPLAKDIFVHNQLANSADSLTRGLNRLAEKINIERTMKRAVMDAHFLMGIVRVGLEPTSKSPRADLSSDPGQPFVERISPVDWVHDMRSKAIEQMDFMGHRYNMPLWYLEESGYYDKKIVKELMSEYAYEEPSDGDEGYRAIRSLTADDQTGADDDRDLIRKVQLWDIYVPHVRKIVTLCGSDLDKVLREIDYEGPDEGPYHLLGFADVPDNVIPLCPAAEMIDLHDLIVEIVNKVARQARKAKTVLTHSGAATEEVGRILGADDITHVRLDQMNEHKWEKIPGVDPTSLAFAVQMMNEFKMLGGNLDALGGLSPQSRTATQDQLLTESASKRVGEMQNNVIRFSESVFRSLGWWLFYDPLIELPITKQIGEVEIPWTFTPEDVSGDFLDYNFGIDVFSLGDNSPTTKLAALTQTFMEIVQLAPFMQQAGLAPDIEEYLKLKASWSNTPQIARLVRHMQPPEEQSVDQPIGEPPSKLAKPAVTTRRYERVNRPGATNQGKDKVLQAMLLGKQAQPSEMAAMSEPSY